MIRSGIVSITFRKLLAREIVHLAAKASLDGIEWGGDIHVPHGDLGHAREVRSMTLDAGLEVAAYGSYYRVGHSETEGLSFDQVLATAVELGAPLIRVWPGKQGSSESSAAYRSMVASDAFRIAEKAMHAGIIVSYEYHGNTLTDTTDSALNAFREVNHTNLKTLWQPPNGADIDYCISGLQQILPYLTNVHVFHWWPKSSDRRALADGTDRWHRYFELIPGIPDRFALLEFVKDDSVEQFLRDAAVLREWLGRQ